MKTINVTCRYGIQYSINAHGSVGEINRLATMLRRCCCYVCHNHQCTEARDKRITEEHCSHRYCKVYTNVPYCRPKAVRIVCEKCNKNNDCKIISPTKSKCDILKENFLRRRL